MNAIILAAGMGSRIQSLSQGVPKPLIDIRGSTIIENQITCLKNAGIDDIIVVVGYKHEAFSFLRYKHNVKLFYNPFFGTMSNIYSLYLCRENCSNTWILEGDVYITGNLIDSHIDHATIFVGRKEYLTGEGIVEFDTQHFIKDFRPGTPSIIPVPNVENKYIPCGITYINEELSSIICENLSDLGKRPAAFNDYRSWDYLLIENRHYLQCKARVVNYWDWIEIDTPYDYAYATNLLNRMNSKCVDLER